MNELRKLRVCVITVMLFSFIGCSDNQEDKNSRQGGLIEIIDEDLNDYEIVKKEEVNQEENTLNRLRGILASNTEEKKENRIIELEFDNIEDLTLTPEQRADMEFRNELRSVQGNIFRIEERTRSLVQNKEYTKEEIREMLLSITTPLNNIQDNIYGSLRLRQATEITALAIDKNGLMRARNIMEGELNRLEQFQKEVKLTTNEIEEIKGLKRVRGFTIPNRQLDGYINNLNRFNESLDRYYKMVLGFNLWINRNWEYFEDEFGTRVIKDMNIGEEYNKRSDEIINLRTRVERYNKDVKESFIQLRRVLE